MNNYKNNILKIIIYFVIVSLLGASSSYLIYAQNAGETQGGGGCGPGTYPCNRGCCDVGPIPDPPPPCDDSCSGCTPSCPTGYTRVRPNNLCANDVKWASCGYNNDCGNWCGGGANCYRLETNIAPTTTPSSVILTLDGINYYLSSNPSAPTIIKSGSANSSATVSIYPTISADININRGVGYILRSNNQGVNGEWAAFDCSRTEDLCREGTTNYYAFNPSIGLANVFKPNAIGDIGALYYSINRCDDGRKYSATRQTYYRVNSEPVRTSVPSITKDNSTGVSTVSMSFRDDNGDALQGVIAWFSTTGNTNTQKITTVVGTPYTGSNESDLAIMILADKRIFLLNSTNNTWSYVGTGSGIIKNTSNQNILSISNVTTSTASAGAYSFQISPLTGSNTSFCSTYAFYSTAIDNYMIINPGNAGNYSIVDGTKIDHSRMTSTSTYKFETNSTVSLPSQTGTLSIDGVSYPNMSLNSSLPTIVKTPSADNVTVYSPRLVSIPIGSKGYVTSTTPATFTRNEFPSGETKSIVETYSTQNRCDSNWLSISRSVYYKTNNIPTMYDESGGSCPMTPDAQCTLNAIFDDIGGEDSRTKTGGILGGGCTTTTYTGIEANNPIKVSIEAQDMDGNSEIEGSILWLSKTTPPQAKITRSDIYTYTDIDNIGVMILNDQAYAITHNNEWVSIPDGILKRSDGRELARVSNITVTDESTHKKMAFQLVINSHDTNNPNGEYTVNVAVLDRSMVNLLWIDQSAIKRYFNWSIDLSKPNVDSFKHTIKDMQTMNVTWALSDIQSNIKEYVINAYRSEVSAINTSISIANNPNSITLNSGTPPEAKIGNPRNPNQWEYLNINNTSVSGNSDVDISSNEGGAIDMYITAFDQACNYTTSPNNSVNLDPWISTKGGILYSKGNILTNAKDLSSVDDSYYNIGGIPTITNALKSELKIGSEVISSSSSFIRNIIETNKTSAKATNVLDTNDRQEEYFDVLKKNLSKKQEGVVEITDINSCPTSAKCLMYTTENIVIPSDYVCDKTILFMSEGNITLNPNLISNRVGLNGCMFIARENIEILEGAYRSQNVVGYDYIDGLIYAGNQVTIPFVDGSKAVRDGIEINGGLIAFGKDLVSNSGESAISQSRNLRLYNDINPALVVTYDMKYSKISEIFFGKEASIFKREVGYKP